MIPYSRDFDPPAPLLMVTFLNTTNQRRRRTLSALVDSGADVSALPAGIIDALRLYPYRRVRLEGLDGPLGLVPSYAVLLRMEDGKTWRVEVVASSLGFPVLGRDVLNRLNITLDGPNLAFSVR